jgi:hypothetical protein
MSNRHGLRHTDLIAMLAVSLDVRSSLLNDCRKSSVSSYKPSVKARIYSKLRQVRNARHSEGKETSALETEEQKMK